MACIKPDGSLTETAKALLRMISSTAFLPEEISAKLHIPIYLVRSSIREMSEADLMQEQHGKYIISEKGKTHIG
jgi:predicted transcriptional regulator